jgi:hypothetical protein
MVEVIEDPALGRLTFDDAGEWYEGKAEITPGRMALVFVCPEPDVTDGPTAVHTARDTLACLRHADAELRRAAAVELAASYPERVSPLSVEEVAAALWAAVVYFWDNGGARVDWDAEPPLLGWHSCNWTTGVDPSGRATESGWA